MLRIVEQEDYFAVVPVVHSFYVSFGVSFFKILLYNKSHHVPGYLQSIKALMAEFKECRSMFRSEKTLKRFSVIYQFLVVLNENEEKITEAALKRFMGQTVFMKAVNYFFRSVLGRHFPGHRNFLDKNEGFKVNDEYLTGLANALKVHISISCGAKTLPYYCDKQTALLVFLHLNENGFCLVKDCREFQMYVSHNSGLSEELLNVLNTLASEKPDFSKLVCLQKAVFFERKLLTAEVENFIRARVQGWTSAKEWFSCSKCRIQKKETIFRLCENGCCVCHACAVENFCPVCSIN